MQIKKRDGRLVAYNRDKIVDAVLAAFEEVDGSTSEYAWDKANNIADYIESKLKSDKNVYDVEAIQDMCENGLMSCKRKDVARAYITYRNERTAARETPVDEAVQELINGKSEYWNTENSNKNVNLVTTQRDYIAGITSKDIARKYIFPRKVMKAHDMGALHIHDMDYMAQSTLHNCLDVNTPFITDKGVKTFDDFKDGDIVTVLTKSGTWKRATVKSYGQQDLYKYTFYNNKKAYTQEVLATENHRWYLKDGSVTTNLSIGDKLVKAPIIYNQDEDYDSFTEEEKLLWCKGFAMGDGTVEFNGANKHLNSTRIRLCGEKDNQWLDRFNIEGCKIREQTFDNGDHSVVVYNYHKEVPNFKNVNEVKAFFNGLYCADGKMSINNPHARTYRIQSSNKDVIDCIRKYAPVAGLYITRENDLTSEKTNFTNDEGRKYTILFSFNPCFHRTYTVLNKEFVKNDTVWCLEVEDEHNFVLANGIVTGNCDLINLNDMLQNGTVLNGVMIEKPHRLITAMTIATQIVSAVASSSYGGCTFTFSHLAPFVRDSYNRYINKYENAGLKPSQVEELAKEDLKKEISDAIQTMNYQLNSFTTTNG